MNYPNHTPTLKPLSTEHTRSPQLQILPVTMYVYAPHVIYFVGYLLRDWTTRSV